MGPRASRARGAALVARSAAGPATDLGRTRPRCSATAKDCFIRSVIYIGLLSVQGSLEIFRSFHPLRRPNGGVSVSNLAIHFKSRYTFH